MHNLPDYHFATSDTSRTLVLAAQRHFLAHHRIYADIRIYVFLADFWHLLTLVQLVVGISSGVSTDS